MKSAERVSSASWTHAPPRAAFPPGRPCVRADRSVVVPGVQPQLAIGRTTDASEREADRAADTIMQEGNARRPLGRVEAAPPEGLAMSAESANLVTGTVRSSGQALDGSTRTFMEQRFGTDFSQVRIHADREGARSADSIGANAYTLGHHIVFGANRFAPATASGRRLIAHELSHVVQQSRGGAPVVAREPSDDPDKNVSLGYLDNKYVSKAAEEVVGPRHWAILREFLRGLWGGLQAVPPEQRAKIDKKMEDFGLTNALKYAGGYALGIVEGLWTSIKGLAEAVVTLVLLPYHIGKFLGEHVPPLAVKYGPRIAQILAEKDGITKPVVNALGTFLASPGKTVRQLGALFDALGTLALMQVRKLGRGLAGEVLKVMEQPWFEYGRSVGKLVGMVLFEVILAVASDAIANIVKQALSVAARLTSRAVTGAVHLVKSAGRFIGEAVEWVGRLGRKAAGEVGEMFEGLRALLNRIKALLAELGEEAALTDAGGMHMPVPETKALNLESRALGPPTRTSPATVADLTPPKVHPSKAGTPPARAGSTSEDIAAVMEEATGGTHRPQSIPADSPHTVADEALPKGLTDPTKRGEADAARRALRGATQAPPSRLWQKHHLVPWELRENPAVYEYERLVAKIDNPRASVGNRWMNQPTNNLTMPSAKGLPGGEGMAIHRGSHPKYTSWMEGRLGQLWQEYQHKPLSVEEFARRFESLVGEAENALMSGRFGEKLP